MPVVITPAPSAEPISDGRFPYGEVIIVRNRATETVRDGAGNRVPGAASDQPYIGAFDPAFGFESTNNTEGTVSTQPGVYLPFVAVVKSSSQVLVRGEWYEVDGDPQYWANPHTGDKPGVQVPLRKSSG